MNIAGFWNESWTAVGNHLWQSTVVVAIAWLLTLALRKNHARARHWVWMAASAKFLLPFSLLMAAGEWMRSLMPATTVARPAVADVVVQVMQPFAEPQFFDAAQGPVLVHRADWLPVILLAVWAFGALIVAGWFARGWWKGYRTKRRARAIDLAANVPVLCSATLMEPGIFGIFRPVLLLPEGILERLSAEQMRVIVVHELCHVRRRDNLTFAVHMVVEALFWFHPAVWWIGARLIDERERACDEAVVQAGCKAEVYAEGILNVCKFYVESPLACVTGVTGADLKKRIVRIMTEQIGRKLNLSKKAVLAAAGSVAVITPIVAGLITVGHSAVQSLAANVPTKAVGPMPADADPSFEVATIKPTGPTDTNEGFHVSGHRIFIENETVNNLILFAFAMHREQIVDRPGWFATDRYDIHGIPDADGQPSTKQMQKMVEKLLQDRFSLRFHKEKRELSVFAITVAKNGPKLTKSKAAPNALPDENGRGDGHHGIRMRFTNNSMSDLALELQFVMDRPVLDETRLTGRYDFVLDWARSEVPSNDPNTPPEIFTAMQDQLGLKLESKKDSAEVMLIDHVERPSPN